MQMKVETLPNYRIAYVRQTGPYGPANAQAMEKVKEWAMERNLLDESAILLGIPQDNPETTLPENCRYDACIVISRDYPIDDSICESEFHGGEYAVCIVKHTAEEMQRAWAELLSAVHHNEFRIDNKPIIEKYTGEMLNNDLCEICIPIKMQN
ncbi:GyrI-like domain-containing protein [Paenibacillus chartarius]|uniref:GyrI-like domain-containing protein n=1 Tax=Paenibacillus chartarius TaxID=747481 RepID=A0ABV6DLW8_9BACL